MKPTDLAYAKTTIRDLRAIGERHSAEVMQQLLAERVQMLRALKAARHTLANAIAVGWEGATKDDITGHVTIKQIDAAIAKAEGGAQ